MAELTLQLPDDLDARLRLRAAEHGEALTDFITRALQEQLAYEDDTALQARVAESIDRSLAEFKAGQGIDARQAMREIADEFGIRLRR